MMLTYSNEKVCSKLSATQQAEMLASTFGGNMARRMHIISANSSNTSWSHQGQRWCLQPSLAPNGNIPGLVLRLGNVASQDDGSHGFRGPQSEQCKIMILHCSLAR